VLYQFRLLVTEKYRELLILRVVTYKLVQLTDVLIGVF
jgi:hypothetical protein